MPQSTVRSRTVQQLVDILEHPRSRTTKKIKEPNVDREEVRKHMRLKWKGNPPPMQTPATSTSSSTRCPS